MPAQNEGEEYAYRLLRIFFPELRTGEPLNGGDTVNRLKELWNELKPEPGREDN